MRKMFAITNRHTGDIAKERNGDHAIFDTKTYAIWRAQVMTNFSQGGFGSQEEFNVVPVKVPRMSWEENFFSRYAQGFAWRWKNDGLGNGLAIFFSVITILIPFFMEDGTEPNTIVACSFLFLFCMSLIFIPAFFDMPSKDESTLYQQAEILHDTRETVEV